MKILEERHEAAVRRRILVRQDRERIQAADFSVRVGKPAVKDEAVRGRYRGVERCEGWVACHVTRCLERWSVADSVLLPRNAGHYPFGGPVSGTIPVRLASRLPCTGWRGVDTFGACHA